MIRTSSARRRRLRIAAGAALAAAALTACGAQPAHQGAAAVVGGERISIAAVEARVAEVRDAADRQSNGPHTERAGLAKQTVSDLVLDRVITRALTDRGLSVTASEVAGARGSDAQVLGGDSALQRELLAKQGVPGGAIDDFYRERIGLSKLAADQGQDARTAAGDAAIRKALTEAGIELKITVNPRYGQWDPQQIGLVDTVDNWLPQNRQVY